jgi:hypothetical protein
MQHRLFTCFSTISLLVMASGCAVANDPTPETLGVAAAAYSTAPAALPGWPRIPAEAKSEAWLIDGQVGLSFERAERRGRDEQGNARPECTAVYATKAKATIYTGTLAQLPRSGGTGSIAVVDGIGSAFGSGTRNNPAFDNLAFRPAARVGTGEPGLTADVRDFAIAVRCSGVESRITQATTLSRAYADGSKTSATGTTSLAYTVSIANNFGPRPTCITETANAPAGVLVERCLGAPSQPYFAGYNQLRIRVVGDATSGVNVLSRDYSIWLSVNGVSNRYPMYCGADDASRYPKRACIITLADYPSFAGQKLDDGPVLDRDAFRWARRDGGSTANAWDVEFALVSDRGEWLKAGNSNFSARFSEKIFR